MKKPVRSLLAAIGATLGTTLAANADSVNINGTNYTYTVLGGGGARIDNIFPWPSGDYTIPGTLNGNPVTVIGSDLFYYNDGLTSVAIPAGVTEIGLAAFWGCENLRSVAIPQGVTNIGYGAFLFCASLTNAALPSSVASIGVMAFENCASLTDMTIPSNLKQIEESLFSGCAGLTNVVISEGVTGIGMNAFENCAGLKSVTLPTSVTDIGSYAFFGCAGLTNVTIQTGVTAIRNAAFAECSALEGVTLPATLADIEWFVFDGCTALRTVRFLGDAPNASVDLYFETHASLTTYVNPGSKGWDGDPNSTALPPDLLWPLQLGNRRAIAHYAGAIATLNGIAYGWLEGHYPNDPRGYEALSILDAANGMSMYDCYVADLDPNDPGAVFAITSFAIKNGVPVLKWNPDSANRHYTVLGKEKLTDLQWAGTNTLPNAHFFMIRVEVPGQ
ncbi:MAG: leucine-rich repeat domain-containing protein [Kiritimatiellaeota bacterium]|nr:leucine-rich repeat domain-containing protein [Kiritimatiellota bacterium]